MAGEAIGRRPALVVLGATLAALPGRERQGMSWLRRLFSGGGEAARWQKALAPVPGQPHVDLVISALRPDDAALGPMARFALGCGLLAHELLELQVGPTTSSLQGPHKAAVERAQARLWLQSLELKNGRLEHEWKPVLEFADPDAHKRTLQHLDRALKRAYGNGPGEGALGRWMKALAAEVAPLAEGKSALPPSLSVADADARAAHFDQVALVEKVKDATSSFVVLANRLAEAFTKGAPEQPALADALGAKLEAPKADIAEMRTRWKTWLDETRDATMTRGRNPKPAFAEGELAGPPSNEHRLASITKVMSLADLPPEADSTGAPPLPEMSGPVTGPPPLPPTMTQEVSLAQIEGAVSSAASGVGDGFAAPPMTQEVSLAQIESQVSEFNAPAHTQEVSVAQLVPSGEGSAGEAAPAGSPPTHTTQPISQAELEKANAEDAALRARAVSAEGAAVASSPAPSPPPPPLTDPPSSAPPDAHENGAANGAATHTAPDADADAHKAPAPANEPPRE